MAVSHALAPDGKNTIFSFYDLDNDRLDEIPVPLELGHTCLTHPAKKTWIVIPESAGERACIVDLAEKRVVRTFTSTSGRLFAGHGVFKPDGSLIYFSEFEPDPSGKGFVTVLNGSDFSKVDEFPSGGRFPHDVTLSKDGKTLIAANLGVEEGPHVKKSGTFVSLIEVSNKRLVDRIELNENPDEMDPSVPDPIMRTDARYFIDYLHVAHPDYSTFIYAHSHRPVVIIWDTRKKKMIKEFPFDEQPIALVTWDREYAAVVTESGRLRFLNTKKLEFDDSIRATRLLKANAHLNRWNEPS